MPYFGEHVYERSEEYDPVMADAIPQLKVQFDLADPPDRNLLRRYARCIRRTTPGLSGIESTLWHVLVEDNDTLGLAHDVVLRWWRTEEFPTNLELNELRLLPKPGKCPRKAGNRRGIMLRETFAKLLSSILVEYLLRLCGDDKSDIERGDEDGRGAGGGEGFVRGTGGG